MEDPEVLGALGCEWWLSRGPERIPLLPGSTWWLAAAVNLRGRRTDAETCTEPAPEVVIDGNSKSDLHIFPSPQELGGSCDFELIPTLFFVCFCVLIPCVEGTAGSENRLEDSWVLRI